MKKEEIIYVRILTVIGASALMALILIFGAGADCFSALQTVSTTIHCN